MDVYIQRIQDALDRGNFKEALRRSNQLLRSNYRGADGEGKDGRSCAIEMIHESGVYEKIFGAAEEYLREGRGIAFGLLYELYKFELLAFGKPSLRVMEGLTVYYESCDDRMSAIGLSENLLKMYEDQGGEEQLEAARKRVQMNIQRLQEKAASYQEAGEHRYAFNSYSCLLECDFDNYEYHFGYLTNAIKSGKPQEAYNELLKNKQHRDYVLGDETLKGLYYDLARVVSADEERPDVLQ